MSDNLERNDTVQYQLSSDSFGLVTIQEPKSWDQDTLSYTRIKDRTSIVK